MPERQHTPLGEDVVTATDDHGGKRRLLLTQPGQIRWLPPEQIGDGIHEDAYRSTGPGGDTSP